MSTSGLLILVGIWVHFSVWIWCQSIICFCFLDWSYSIKTLKEAREVHCMFFISTSYLFIVLISSLTHDKEGFFWFCCAIWSIGAGAIEDTNMVVNGEAIFTAENAIGIQYSCWCRSEFRVGDLSDFWKGGALVRDSETDHGYILHIEMWEVCAFLDMAGLLHNLGRTKRVSKVW